MFLGPIRRRRGSGKHVNILAKDVAVDCHGNLTVNTSRILNKRKKTIQDEAEQTERKAFRKSLGNSMKSIALTQLKENLRVTMETAAKCEVKALTEQNPPVKRVCQRLKKEQEKLAAGLKKEIAEFTKATATDGDGDGANEDHTNEDDKDDDEN